MTTKTYTIHDSLVEQI